MTTTVSTLRFNRQPTKEELEEIRAQFEEEGYEDVRLVWSPASMISYKVVASNNPYRTMETFPFFPWNEESLPDGSAPYTHRQCTVCRVWVPCPQDAGQDYAHWKECHKGPEGLAKLLQF